MIWKPAHIRQITNTNLSPIPTNYQYQQITYTNKSPIPRGADITGSHIRQFWSNQDHFNNSRSWSLCKHSDVSTLVKVKVDLFNLKHVTVCLHQMHSKTIETLILVKFDLVDFKHVGSLFTSNALENLKISPTTIEAQL